MSLENSPIRVKSFQFACEIVCFTDKLKENKLSSVDVYLHDGKEMLAYQKIIQSNLPAQFIVKNRFPTTISKILVQLKPTMIR